MYDLALDSSLVNKNLIDKKISSYCKFQSLYGLIEQGDHDEYEVMQTNFNPPFNQFSPVW